MNAPVGPAYRAGKSFRRRKVIRLRFLHIGSFLGTILAGSIVVLLLFASDGSTPSPAAFFPLDEPEQPQRDREFSEGLKSLTRRVAKQAEPLIRRHRAAIILDDVGLEWHLVKKAARLRYPITFSVLPHRKYTRASAQYLHEMGYEIMLHLPMEPDDPSAGNRWRSCVRRKAGSMKKGCRSCWLVWEPGNRPKHFAKPLLQSFPWCAIQRFGYTGPNN